MVKGMGGAMDLVNGARRIVVSMEQLNRSGETKVRRECTLPLAGERVVDRLITDLAVFDFSQSVGMLCTELQQGARSSKCERAPKRASSTRSPEGHKSMGFR
jgi:3-oxoacid CoA-transferase subunit B